MNLAEDALKELYDIQDQQIDLRSEIVKLLDQKLSFIYSIQNGTVEDDDADDTSTVITPGISDTTEAASSETTVESSEATDNEAMTADADSSTTDTETLQTEDASANEIVTDEAVIASAFDDGADLEEE